jgi:hypothetical protein
MKKIKLSLIVSFALLFVGCTTLEHMDLLTPRPSKSEYFETTVAGILLKVDAGKILSEKYDIVLTPLKTLPDGALLEVEFENPVDSSKPMLVTQKVDAAASTVRLESPSFHGIKAYKNYQTVVRMYADESKSKLIGVHEQLIRSIVDDADLSGR